MKGDGVEASDQAQGATTATGTTPLPRPQSPLIIGGIACGTIVWMFIVIMLLIAWKLFS